MVSSAFLWWILPLLGILVPGVQDIQNPGREPAEGDFIRLFLCGDVMLGRGIDQILPHPVDPELHESYVKSAVGYVELAEKINGKVPSPVEPRYIWGRALDFWKEYDPEIKIINLETSITTSDAWWPGKAVNYRMHPENVVSLTTAGIDYCALANNHLLDFSRPGMDQTMQVLGKEGIKYSGSGQNLSSARTPVIFPINGKGRIIVFSAGMLSSGIPRTWAATENRSGIYVPDSDDALVTYIKEFNREKARPGDIILVSVHWGSNWGYEVPVSQQELAHQLIDEAGVDVIHGHSSHHFKGIEIYNGKPVIYGAGDFINDYEGIGGNEIYRGEISLMYFADMGRDGRELERLIIIPLKVSKMQLNSVNIDESQWVLEVLNHESEKFETRFRMVHKDRIEWIPNKY